jgi:predicted nucleotidyltransferase
MVDRASKELAYEAVRKYVAKLREEHLDIWRVYLYGSYKRGTYHVDSDIDLAVFWDRDAIDGLDEDLLLMKLRRDIDLRIEPHSFARTDFDETDPFIREIIETGEPDQGNPNGEEKNQELPLRPPIHREGRHQGHQPLRRRGVESVPGVEYSPGREAVRGKEEMPIIGDQRRGLS